MIIGGALFGNTFFARADPFEVYSSLVAQVSIWGRRDGQLLLRSPLANLDTTPATPGLIGVVAVLFGSTAFDAFRDSTRWLTFIQGNGTSTYLQNNLGLLAFCLAVGAIFWLACVCTGVGPEQSRRATQPVRVLRDPDRGRLHRRPLPSFFVEVGTQTLVQASDPLSNGSNILGTGALVRALLAVVPPDVPGEHEGPGRRHRSRRRCHRRPRAGDQAAAGEAPLTGQLPLLAAMICFTVGGLYLLFST